MDIGLSVLAGLDLGKEQKQLDTSHAWGQVYGRTKLLVEGRITPQANGFKDLESFVVKPVHQSDNKRL